MLAQRLRRWPNIKTALFQRVVFAERSLRDDGGCVAYICDGAWEQGRIQDLKKEGAQVVRGEFLGIFRPI